MWMVVGGGRNFLVINTLALGVLVCCTGYTFKVGIFSFNKYIFRSTSFEAFDLVCFTSPIISPNFHLMDCCTISGINGV